MEAGAKIKALEEATLKAEKKFQTLTRDLENLIEEVVVQYLEGFIALYQVCFLQQGIDIFEYGYFKVIEGDKLEEKVLLSSN